MFKLLDLFSGIGGFSLGLERSGFFKTVAFCEIEPFPRAVLRKHWPEIPIYEDVRILTAERLAADGIAVDAICGGFPCQDISEAGNAIGIEGVRSGLWGQIARLTGELRPRILIVENVSNLLAGGRGAWFGRILGDMASLGYNAEWHCIPASSIGAPHERERVWIIADCLEVGRNWSGGYFDGKHVVHKNSQWENASRWSKRGDVVSWLKSDDASFLWSSADAAHSGMDDGVSDGLDRIGALGNAVVPQIPEIIGRAIGLSTDVRHTQQLAAE